MLLLNSFSDFEGSLPETNVKEKRNFWSPSICGCKDGIHTQSNWHLPIAELPWSFNVSEVPVSKFAKMNPASFLHGFRLVASQPSALSQFLRSGFCSMIAGNRNNQCHILTLKKIHGDSSQSSSRWVALASAHHILYIDIIYVICVSYLDKTFHATSLRKNIRKTKKTCSSIYHAGFHHSEVPQLENLALEWDCWWFRNLANRLICIPPGK